MVKDVDNEFTDGHRECRPRFVIDSVSGEVHVDIGWRRTAYFSFVVRVHSEGRPERQRTILVPYE